MGKLGLALVLILGLSACGSKEAVKESLPSCDSVASQHTATPAVWTVDPRESEYYASKPMCMSGGSSCFYDQDEKHLSFYCVGGQ
jgi:hypothetical protein